MATRPKDNGSRFFPDWTWQDRPSTKQDFLQVAVDERETPPFERFTGDHTNVVALRPPFAQRLPARVGHSSWVAFVDRIVGEIGRLQPNWDGLGGVLPSVQTVRDLEAVLNILPTSTAEPEVEADSSDGSVCCSWWSADYSTGLTATFTGKRKAVFVLLVDKNSTTHSFAAEDETRILDFWHDTLAKLSFLRTDA